MNFAGATAAIRAFKEASRNNAVDESELMRRYKICEKCPKLGNVVGVSVASQVLGRIANKNKVPRHVHKKRCNVCSCAMLLLLPTKPEHLHKDTPEQKAERPANCWLLELD